MAWLAEWESKTTMSRPFHGIWRVRSVPDELMISCSNTQMISTTREGIKTLLRDSGNGHPVRFQRGE